MHLLFATSVLWAQEPAQVESPTEKDTQQDENAVTEKIAAETTPWSTTESRFYLSDTITIEDNSKQMLFSFDKEAKISIKNIYDAQSNVMTGTCRSLSSTTFECDINISQDNVQTKAFTFEVSTQSIIDDVQTKACLTSADKAQQATTGNKITGCTHNNNETQSNTESPQETKEKVTKKEPVETTPSEISEEQTQLSNRERKEAEELSSLSKKQLYWLKPLPQRFEQNPYLHVDFTSYTLEWGEVQVGLNNFKVGVLPRVQLGSSLPMWLVGLQNADAKINLVRLGAFDIGLDGNWLSMPSPEFNMGYLSGGLNTSIRILEPWTVHFGSQYMSFSAVGLPDLSNVNSLILTMSGINAQEYREELAADGVGFDLTAKAITLKLAMDFRMNRRDSWILQAQGIVWHSLHFSSNLNDSEKVPKFFNIDKILALESEGGSDITKSYVVSLAHQWSWNNSYLRIGFGWSSMEDYAFVPAMLQSIDYAWRFGGKSKNKEGRIRKGWRENRSKSDKNEKDL